MILKLKYLSILIIYLTKPIRTDGAEMNGK